MFLHAKLARSLAAAACGFLTRHVAHPQLTRVNHQAAAIYKHLRLARRGLYDDGALEYRSDPDAPPIDLCFEVGKDLVVFVHLDGIEPDELNGALRGDGSRLSV
ncbi:MAG TPA: hypothetical protein VFD88_03090 [Clostridia bacterium]|nr:hypothetical protein [Clostridia bacterium]